MPILKKTTCIQLTCIQLNRGSETKGCDTAGRFKAGFICVLLNAPCKVGSVADM